MDRFLAKEIENAVLQQYLDEEKRTGKKLDDIQKDMIATSVKAAIRVVEEYQKRRD